MQVYVSVYLRSGLCALQRAILVKFSKLYELLIFYDITLVGTKIGDTLRSFGCHSSALTFCKAS